MNIEVARNELLFYRDINYITCSNGSLYGTRIHTYMSNKPLNISESAAVQMPMKTVASLILLVAAGVFAYTELTARLVSLETSRELFENDLLKKSEQVPVDQEQHFLLEDLFTF